MQQGQTMGDWGAYGNANMQPMNPQSNLNFVSTSFDNNMSGYRGQPTQPQMNTSIPTASTSFEDEPPLLEELGIDIGAIFKKTMTVFSFKSHGEGIFDSDLSGPLMFILSLGSSHMLAGKLLFGVIIGWTVITSLGMSWLINMLVGPGGDIGMYSCCSILGYGLVPQIFLALTYLLIGKQTALNVFAVICVLWSTKVATRFVVGKLKLNHIPVDEQRSLIAFPWLLTYSMFALLTLY